MGRGLAILAALAAVAAAPASANASVAYHDGNGNPAVQGQPGEANDITATAGGDGVVFTDSAGISPRDPELEQCRTLSETAVTCSGQGAVLHGGDGNDTLRDIGLTGGLEVRGGPGDDTIVAGAVPSFLYGDDQVVRAGDGNDTITGSSAEVSGDGPEDDFADLINGGGGDDTLNGAGGADHVSGQTGDDTVDGGDGNDALDTTSPLDESENPVPGDAGNDTLLGGSGRDDINADDGKDTVDAGAGDDSVRGIDIFALDDDKAADTIRCGDGTDRVIPGTKERLDVACESVEIGMTCIPSPCKAKGTITGKAKGAKKATIVAKASKTVASPDFVKFGLGKKATRLLGGRTSVGLTATIVASRVATVAGGPSVKFVLIR